MHIFKLKVGILLNLTLTQSGCQGADFWKVFKKTLTSKEWPHENNKEVLTIHGNFYANGAWGVNETIVHY